jgi:hypothetical protein
MRRVPKVRSVMTEAGEIPDMRYTAISLARSRVVIAVAIPPSRPSPTGSHRPGRWR